jgi:hypothetical protein
LWSSRTFGDAEAAALFNVLLWELGVSGIKFVSDELIQRRFSGVVAASRSTLLRTVASRRDVLVEKYGPDPEAAFNTVHALDAPFMLERVKEVALDEMQQRTAQAERRAEVAEAKARVTEEDKRDLARLRAKKEEKRRKSQRRARAAHAAKGRRGGRKHKKGTGKKPRR